MVGMNMLCSAETSGMAALMTDFASVLKAVLPWMLDVLKVIIGSPVLLAFVGLSIMGFVIAWVRRFLPGH